MHRKDDWTTAVIAWILVTTSLHNSSGESKITLVGYTNDNSWQSAHNTCEEINKTLCMRKDICQHIGSAILPNTNIRTPSRDVWLPVFDEYNEWIYLGRKSSRKCQKISDIEGPPSWGNMTCADFKVTKSSNKIGKFCGSLNRFYCCEKSSGTYQAPSAQPATVYIKSRKEGGIPYYSFSLESSRNEIAWFTDKASWRKGGRLPGDLSKFTLMTKFVKDKFEDPIFFCKQPVISSNIQIPTTLYLITKKWCSYPWRLDFYLYGSYTKPHTVPSKKLLVEINGSDKKLHSRVSLQQSSMFKTMFSVYGPGSNNETIEFATQVTDPCMGETEILTTTTGVISSPNYPRKYYRGATSDVSCRWKIRVAKGNVIKISFKSLSLDNEKKVPYSTLEFRKFQSGRVSNYNFDKKCKSEKVIIDEYGTFCGTKLPPSFVTVGNEVDINFEGKRYGFGYGFSLFYTSIPPPNSLILERVSKEKMPFFTWEVANQTCYDYEKRLCEAREICSFNSRPFYGVERGDQWAPISNEYNDWIQIGRGNVMTCGRHNKIHGPPQWGRQDKTYNKSSISIPYPKREYLYCCADSHSAEKSPNRLINVLIYSTVQNGVIFFRYLREDIDQIEKSASSGIWSLKRKIRGDFTSIKLYKNYSPSSDKVVYFCSLRLLPAIGKLRKTYSMFLQPCESKGWEFEYYLYAPTKREKGMPKYFVGIYEKRPHHSRVHSKTFPEKFKNHEAYILFSYGSDDVTVSKNLVRPRNSACTGNTSVIIANSVLESPGYPTSYKNNAFCKWRIVMSDEDRKNGNQLKLTIEELSLEDPVDILTIYDIAYDSPIESDDVGLFKSRKDFTGMIGGRSVVTRDSFFLVFKSDETVSSKGFKLRTEIISNECGGTITIYGDTITSPNYPLQYPGGAQCDWKIRAPSEHFNIQIQFQSFDLMKSNECTDSVVIADKTTRYVVCGGTRPGDNILLSSSIASVTFKSKSASGVTKTRTSKGFSAKVYFHSTNSRKNITDEKIPQCGIQSVPFPTGGEAEDRIVGGLKAERGNFPWVVMIGTPGVACGGALVNDRWVLTATHCFVSQFIRILGIMIMNKDLKSYIVIAGRYERNKPSPNEQIFNVTKIGVHYGFKRYTTRWLRGSTRILGVFPYNDITVARLSRKAVFSPTVSPVCLPTQEAHVGEFCYVAGWGSKHPSRIAVASALNYAKVPILDSSLCNGWKEMKDTVMKNAMCAGFPNGGSDHCWGDSGGPLMCRGRYGNFYINGIVSWSIECGGKRTPGVYTRVWNYVEWIKKIIERE